MGVTARLPRRAPLQAEEYVTNGIRLVRIIRVDKGDIALVEDAVTETVEYMKLTGWVRPVEWRTLKGKAVGLGRAA